jgi:hypothetical protein
LQDAKRPIVIFNRVGTTVDSVSGQEVGNRQEVQFLPRRQRARQLAAITRKVPGVPIDRRTVQRFEPLRASPVVPAVDMRAVQNERMAAAAAASKTRRRRDEEALLLLAC